MWLQDMPHTFSFMQAWQMANPQRQRQQKVKWPAQQWQRCAVRRERPQREGREGGIFSLFFMAVISPPAGRRMCLGQACGLDATELQVVVSSRHSC